MNTVTYPELHIRADYLKSFEQIVQPAMDQLTPEHPGLLSIGSSGTIYSKKIREAEGFLRLLWGYAPFYVNHPIDANFERLIAGIVTGVDPDSPDYWGDVDDVNQLMVEMAPLAVFLIMNQEKVWQQTTTEQRTNIFHWINQINSYETAQNNWLFFRVLVNVCLHKNFNEDTFARIEQDLTKIETFYVGNGWYFDGVSQQRDYYISFAIHYYSLIYAVLFEKEDPERSKLFKERAAEFAVTFQAWFDAEGRGLPFGRSLTYRFAQSAFWSALIFAKVDDFDLRKATSLLGKNLAFWLSQDIFSTDGLLKIGYCYENLVMAEEYNGPGSPYWALKAFLVFALPETDEFWAMPTAEETADGRTLIEEAHMLVTRSENGTHVQSYPTGQYVLLHTHGEAKYCKFVYSTLFGFNVPKGLVGLDKGAFDNVLAVSERDQFYRVRTIPENFEVTSDYVKTEWRPWNNVTITSWIVPFGSWHFRLHLIDSERELAISDGGFSVPFDGAETVCEEVTEDMRLVYSAAGVSGAVSLTGAMQPQLSARQANVNVLYNNVVFPYLSKDIEKGQTLICNAFLGSQTKKVLTEPTVTFTDTEIIFQVADEEKRLSLPVMTSVV